MHCDVTLPSAYHYDDLVCWSKLYRALNVIRTVIAFNDFYSHCMVGTHRVQYEYGTKTTHFGIFELTYLSRRQLLSKQTTVSRRQCEPAVSGADVGQSLPPV